MSKEKSVGDAKGLDAVRNSSSISLYKRGAVLWLKRAVYGVELSGDMVKWIAKLSRFPIHGSVSRYPLSSFCCLSYKSTVFKFSLTNLSRPTISEPTISHSSTWFQIRYSMR
jgi:hypothetical protein